MFLTVGFVHIYICTVESASLLLFHQTRIMWNVTTVFQSVLSLTLAHKITIPFAPAHVNFASFKVG